MQLVIRYQKAIPVDAQNTSPLIGGTIKDAVFSQEADGKKKKLELTVLKEDGTHDKLISSRPKIRHEK